MKKEIIGNCELYLGDCLEIIPQVTSSVDAVVTDPVWPNNSVEEFAHIEPYDLFKNAWKLVERTDRMFDLKRAIIQLGCDSNPSILFHILLPFFRIVWLEYAVPGHKGRLLNSGDVAYLYGVPPKAIPGKKLISEKCISTNNFGKETEHPCPRKLEHVKWLVYQFTELNDVVLDPFMGSGTTGVACIEQEHKRKFIGIEINEKYFDVACKRIEFVASQNSLDFGGSQ